MYDHNDECRVCGEHIASAHAPECSFGNAESLRIWGEAAIAERDERAGARALAAADMLEADARDEIVLADQPEPVLALVNDALRAAGLFDPA